MGKFNQLLGVANNLADSFVSVTNFEFLRYIESQSVEKTKSFEINLLKKIISPKELSSEKAKKVIEKYNNWFLIELKKLKIELSAIKNVLIKIVYKPGKIFSRNYTCNVTISANGKDYTKKIISSYA